MSNDATGLDSSLDVDVVSGDFAGSDSSPTLNPLIDTAIRLKLIRDAAGFSQRELAKRAGVTNSSISMIEQGQVSPSIQSLSRILAAFPISLAEFFSFKLPNPSFEFPALGFVGDLIDNNRQQLEARTDCLLSGESTAFRSLVVESCGVVLSGSLQLTLVGANRTLNQGESFYVPANQLFRLINLSGRDVSFFCCSLFVHK